MRSSPPTDGPSTGFASRPEELDAIVDGITDFLDDHVAAAGRSGVVVEVGGGLNAAVATMLAVDALGADRVFGLVLPAYMSTEADALTAELVAEGLGIEYATVQLLPFVHLFQELSLPESADPVDADATAKAVDRMRMAAARYVADARDRYVLGTEDRTEWLLGTGTPHGVRRGDLRPLGDLYRTEVRNLAEHVGIPRDVCETTDGWDDRPPVPGVDVSPTTIDAVLRLLVDEDEDIERTAAELDVDPALVRRVAERHVRSADRRGLPPSPKTAAPDRYDRFHEIELRFD